MSEIKNASLNNIQQDVPVYNPQGELVRIAAKDVATAVGPGGGFRLAKPSEIQAADSQKKYGSENSSINALKTFGYGALDQATFGVGRQVLNATGLSTPEEQAGLQKANPGTSALGNVAGLAGLLFGGEAAGAAGAGAEAAEGVGAATAGSEGLGSLAADVGTAAAKTAINPVGALSKAGSAISEAAGPGAAKVAGLLANPETSPIINKILQGAMTTGLGSAVEGAAYGLGSAVSEDALGDPDALGENLLSHVGYGAALGGVLGGGVGAATEAIPGALNSGKNSYNSISRKIFGAGEEGAEVSLNPLERGYAQASSFVSGKDAQEIEDVLKMRKQLKAEAGGSLDPESLIRTANDDIQNSLANRAGESSTEVGQAVSGGIIQKFGDDAETFNKIYSDLESKFKTVNVDSDIVNSSKKAISDVGGTSKLKSSGVQSFADEVSDALENAKSVNDIKLLRTEVNGKIRSSLDPNFKAAGVRIDNALQEAEQGSISSFAKANSQADGGVASNELDLLEQRRASSEGYKKVKAVMADVKESLTGSDKRLPGPQGFVSYLKSLDPEDFANSLLKKDNQRLLNSLKTNFPEEFEKLANFEKQKIYDKATNNGIAPFDSKKALNYINKYEKETKSLLFSPDELNGLNKANDTYLKYGTYIKKLNSLGAGAHNTYLGEGAAIFAGAHNPLLGATIEGFNALRSPGLTIQRLSKIEAATNSTARIISKSTKGIFNTAAKAVLADKGPIIQSQLMGQRSLPRMAEDMDDYDYVSNQLKQIQGHSPDQVVDNMSAATAELYKHAPKTNQAMNTKMVMATQFLQSKLPQMPATKPLSKPLEPSSAEKLQFMKYYRVVENPTSALEQISNNTLVPETMETLQAVYPQMLAQMQTSLMNEITERTAKDDEFTVPYTTKMMLSAFLGSDFDDTLSQESIAANQLSLTGPSQKEQNPEMAGAGPVKPSSGALSKITKSNSYLTAQQATAQRESEV